MIPDRTHNKPMNGLAQGTPDLSPGVDRLLPLLAEPKKSKSSSHGSLPIGVKLAAEDSSFRLQLVDVAWVSVWKPDLTRA